MDIDIRKILDFPTVYALWQAPFVSQKVAPFLRASKTAPFKRVLEIGCGPGTNAALFSHVDYVGVDLNPRYVQSASQRFRRKFICGDATSFDLSDETAFDAVFINSLLHHLNDEAVEAALALAASMLEPQGRLHLMDLVLPAQRSLARFLAKMDRGGHARPLPVWEKLLGRHFELQVLEPYSVRMCGITGWEMFYFQGCRRDV